MKGVDGFFTDFKALILQAKAELDSDEKAELFQQIHSEIIDEQDDLETSLIEEDEEEDEDDLGFDGDNY